MTVDKSWVVCTGFNGYVAAGSAKVDKGFKGYFTLNDGTMLPADCSGFALTGKCRISANCGGIPFLSVNEEQALRPTFR